MANKILIIRFGSLGDVILTSATVLNFRLEYPDSHLVYLTKERFKPLVATFNGVDEIVTIPDRVGPAEFGRLLNRLDSYNFDLVVDLHGNIRSWLARKVVTANHPVVYPKRRIARRAAVRRRNKRLPESWPHTIDLYNETLTQMGKEAYCRRPLLQPPEYDDLPGILGDSSVPKVVIAPGAAHPTKQWGLKRFAEAAQKLRQETSCHVIWVATSADSTDEDTDKILTDINAIRIVDWPLEKLASLISRADLTLANDSGIMHLASAVGTPVVALFGPTHQCLGFAPRGLFDRVIEVDEACRPCSLHGRKPCFREQRFCFSRIEPDDVCQVANEILDSRTNMAPALFVDRDGTLIVEKNYLSDPDQVELIESAPEALRLATDAGYRVVILSNQSGVARGYFSIEQVERVNGRLLELLYRQDVKVDAVYFCPYYAGGSVREFAVESNLRKPRPGMPEQAAADLGLDLRRSVVIGDKADDVNLGRVIGARSLLVLTGHGKEEASEVDRRNGSLDDKMIFDDILSAVKYAIG